MHTPATQHPQLGNDYSVLSTQYSVLSTLHLPLWPNHAIFLLLISTGLLAAQTPPPASPRLPWESTTAPAEPLLLPPAGPAQVLERFDIGPSQLDNFTSDPNLSPSEEDVLAKILFHLPRLGLDNLHRWRNENPDWKSLAAEPASHRLDVLHLSGRVIRATKISILPEQAELYEFKDYFLVSLQLNDSDHTAIIATRHIPAAWPLDTDLDEPATAEGLFLKLTTTDSSAAQAYFAAPRVAWFPDRPNPKYHIGPADLTLASLGFDAGLWDDVRASDKRSLAAQDREAFYQLLAAAGRDRQQVLRSAAKRPHEVVPLLDKPAEHHGQIGRLTGVARRVLRVPISDLDVRVRLGIDDYYEIDLFLPLGDASLLLGKDPTGQKNPVYRSAFPATLLVRELPRGLSEGENQHTEIAADAVFFKVWAYRSQYAGRFGQLQPAPLFIAKTASVVAVQSHANWVASSLVTTALCIALAVTLLMAWWYRTGDRPQRRITTDQLDWKF